MCSMDVSRSPDSLISCPRFPYHMPPARVLVCFLSVSRVLLYLYEYGLSTRLWLLVCFTFLLLSRRLVHLRFLLMPFPSCHVDSSSCLLLPLTLTCYSLSTRPLTRYSWTMTRTSFCSSLYLYLTDHYIYGLEMWDCSPSSIYFATTLKV